MKAIMFVLCAILFASPVFAHDYVVPLDKPYTSAFIRITCYSSGFGPTISASAGLLVAESSYRLYGTNDYSRSHVYRIDDSLDSVTLTSDGAVERTIIRTQYQLHPADVNCDNRINILDLIAVRTWLGWQHGIAPKNVICDVDRDGVFTVKDLLLIRNALNTRLIAPAPKTEPAEPAEAPPGEEKSQSAEDTEPPQDE